MYDWHAEHSPDHPLFVYPDDNGVTKTINWAEATRAIHQAGRWLLSLVEESLTVSDEKKPLITILANSDAITYYTVFSGGLRVGCPMFPISTRNSPGAVAHLLAKTQPSHILVGPEKPWQDLAAATFKILEENKGMLPHVTTMPVFEDLYKDPSVHVEPLPPFKPNINDLAFIMHSSGSTAFPKPIPQTHLRMFCVGRTGCFTGMDMAGLKMASHVLPTFHAMGIFQNSFTAITGCTISTFKPKSPPIAPTPESMMRAVMATKSDLIFTVPAFISTWLNDPELLPGMKACKSVHWGGGPLAKEVGDRLVEEGIKISSVYGLTEFGSVSWWLYDGPTEDWEYFRFTPELELDLVPVGDGHFQLVIPSVDAQIPCVENTEVNGRKGYDTNDIFAPHPTIPGLWKVYGRADDQIMHSTGEKTNPGPLEHILNEDPHVGVSVVFGRGRFNAGVLIDPKPQFQFDPKDEQKLKELRNMIWPTVERMNEYAPQHSRIFKEMIIFSTPEKPFTYTAKGTARRQAIINDYEDEISAAYDAAEESTQSELTPPPLWTEKSTPEFVREVIQRVMEVSVDDDDDIFRNGCDSLQATWIRNSLVHALKSTTKVNVRALTNNFVYQCPTISALTSFISRLVNHGDQRKDAKVEDPKLAKVKDMLDMVDKYSQDFPLHRPELSQLPVGKVYAVTGTTGGLGCALLAHLCQLEDVKTVYAINRKGKGALSERQRQELKQRGYNPETVFRSGKVVLVEAATEQERLGLTEELYEEIRKSVTHIIHNAWPVNFKLSLHSFEPSVKGVRHLIDLSLASSHPVPPKILFTSSIDVLRHADRTQPTKEGPVDPAISVDAGYGESKWVAERLLQNASSMTPVPTVSVRLGQLSGSDGNGAWNASDWFPSLIKSSLYMECVPTMPKEISWIPVDVAARALVEMADADVPFLHLVHPRSVPWSSIMEPLAHSLGLPIVPYDEWVSRLEKSGEGLSADEEVGAMRLNPALKIIDTYISGRTSTTAPSSNEAMGLPQLDVTEAERVAPSLASDSLPQLTVEDALQWITYWRKIGYL